MNTKRITRREALGTLGVTGAALALGCADSPLSPTSQSSAQAASVASTNDVCAVTPSETAGPYPSLTDLFRSDIRDGKAGTLLTLTVNVVNVNAACAAVANAHVEIWHCDSDGDYSQYGAQVSRTFLRGIQITDINGSVTFTTIYPGWYQGRATHIHLEVTVGGVSRKITQIAFPEDVNDVVHRTGVYATRGTNPTTNLRDNIFADSLASEIVTPTGDPTSGYAATFQCGIAL